MKIKWNCFSQYSKGLVIVFLNLMVFYSPSLFAQTIEICTNGIDDDGDNLVDCFDPDCCGQCPNHYYNSCCGVASNPTQQNYSVANLWQNTTFNFSTFDVPIIGNVDGDPQVEILVRNIYTDAIHIVNHNGTMSGTIFNTSFIQGPFNIAHSSLAIGNLDNIGTTEIVIASYNPGAQGGANSTMLRCFEFNGTNYVLKWSVTNFAYSGTNFIAPSIADFDGDGLAEVYIGGLIYNSNGTLRCSATGSIGRVGNTGVRVATTAVDVLPASPTCPTCDGLELVAGNTVYAVSSNAITPVVTISAEKDGLTSIADWDNDSDLDGIVSTVNPANGKFRVYVWELETPTLLAFFEAPLNSSSPTQVSLPTIANIDIDATPEILITEWSNLYALEGMGSMSIKWTHFTNNLTNMGVPVFDFDGNGVQEFISRNSSNQLAIYNGNTGGSPSELVSFGCPSATLFEYPTIADINGNGTAEIVAVCSKNGGDPGNLTVFRSNSFAWANTRSVWNQYNYFAVNVNDDLSIPRQQQNHGYILGNGELNMFLGQPTILNKVPQDLNVTLQSTVCNGNGSVSVSIKICNTGTTTFNAGLPITTYSSNPTTGTPSIITPASMSPAILPSIAPGGCVIVSLVYNGLTQGQSCHIVANDNGAGGINGSFPIIVNGNRPVGVNIECNYINNMIRFTRGVENVSITASSYCQAPITLTANSPVPVTYLWSPGNQNTQSIVVNQSGQYSVVVTNSSGCTANASINIGIMTLNITGQRVICAGGSTSLTANATSIYLPLSYQWHLNGMPISTSSTLTNITQAGTYSVIVTDANGCSVTATTNVINSTHSVSISASPSLSVCQGQNVTLSTTALLGATYLWSNGGTTFTTTVNQSGKYCVSVTDLNGCMAIACASVTVNPLPDVVIEGSYERCGNETIMLNAIANSPAGIGSISWSNGTIGAVNFVNQAGTYSVTVTDNNGCTTTGSRTVTPSASGNGLIVVPHLAVNGTAIPGKRTALNSDRALQIEFGSAVDINGDFAIVGADQYDGGASAGPGFAYIYQRINGLWTQIQKITAPDGETADMFGYSVAIDGDYAVVGAPGQSHIYDDLPGETDVEAGAAYLFKRNISTQQWVYSGKLSQTPPTGTNYGQFARNMDDNFGWAVSISGDIIAVGAPGYDYTVSSTTPFLESAGAVYIFNATIKDSYFNRYLLVQQKIVSANRKSLEKFGYDVAIDNNKLIVGAPDESGTGNGAAYVYQNMTSSWLFANLLTANNGNLGDEFGTSVDVSGNVFVVGAPMNNANLGLSTAGAAYVFGNGTQNFLVAPTPAMANLFGFDVSIDQNNIIVGSFMAGAGNRGEAYLFQYNGTTTAFLDGFFAPDAQNGDLFGHNVAISGNNILIGAQEQDYDQNNNPGSYMNSSGAVYFFEMDCGCNSYSITTNSSPTCANQSSGSVSVTSINGGFGPYSFLWTPTGSVAQTVNGLPSGTYNVQVTDAGGCTATGSAMVVEQICNSEDLRKQSEISSLGDYNDKNTINGLSETNNSLKVFEVYPNPTNQWVNIEVQLVNNDIDKFINVYNLQGMLLEQISLTNISQILTLDVSKYPSGVYMITLVGEGEVVASKKLIKE